MLVASDLDPTPLGQESDARVAPVDWELAAVGTGLSDLAALISGCPEDGAEIAAAYAAGVPAFGRRELDLARLQVTIQL